MIFALVFIQVFGTLMSRILSAHLGAILTGFFGGLVSSTATTASLARNSNLNHLNSNPNDKAPKSNSENFNEILIFLSATSAMLIEGALIVLSGAKDFDLSLMLIFFGPLLTSFIMIVFYSKKTTSKNINTTDNQFEILPIIKLSIFIITILVISKLLQKVFGQNGLLVLTFLVSLFEIHGSVIANVQIFDSQEISLNLLRNLLAISIFASYLSKLFLIFTLGSKDLKIKAMKCTAFLFLSLFISWVIVI